MDVPLLTLDDWRAAWLAGAEPGALLGAHRQRLLTAASTPAGQAVWIALVDEAQFAAQLDRLAAWARAQPDRAALLARYPLFGVPFAVKDNIDVAGLATTAACPAFGRTAGQARTRSATAVQRLLDAGAVCLGKTNLDQFATGLVGTRSPYGRPASVFDASRISGGSSSGSAVAVASGWVAFALGTDTAGSGRVPAGFNHIVGLKPTPGRISTAGVLPACRSLDCVSIFALTVTDAATVLAVAEGPDEADVYSTSPDSPARLGPTHFRSHTADTASGPSAGSPLGLRLGVPSNLWPAASAPASPLSPGYANSFQRALAHAQSLGHTLVPVDFAPLHAVAELLYSGPWVAERHAVVQELLDSDPQALDPSVRSVIEAARRYSATDAFRGQYRLRELAQQAASIWKPGPERASAGVDALLVPTTTRHPSFAEVDADPVGVNSQLGLYTNFVNLLGWCALALPFERDAGLPFGVTLIAPGGCDAALAAVGRTWQSSRGDEPLGATGRSTRLALEAAATTLGAVAAPAHTPWPASVAVTPLAVVGAHLSGMPLNSQLTERGAVLLESTTTSSAYRLYALPHTTPPKPGLRRMPTGAGGAGGQPIAVEIWALPQSQLGSFLALVPPPLGLGSLELADGRWVQGFICEGHALDGALDVTAFGGWRAYIAALKAQAAVDAPASSAPQALTPSVASSAADTTPAVPVAPAASAISAPTAEHLAVNLPEVQAEVAEVFTRYEAALAAHDVPALDQLFWLSDQVVRYGIAEIQHGADEIAAFRSRGIGIGPNRRLEHTVITTFGHDMAMVMTQFRDDGDPRVGRQSQTWVRWPDGWKVVAAHVSRMPP